MEKNIIVCVGGDQIKSIPVTVKVDKSELDETIDKANKLVEILNEASSLVNELASKDVKLKVYVE
ncbi:MAG: hypothetical protein K5643_05310 [Saccharofermentans sp.]|nr:hypothetical protein [Saccharofermentans sp.]